MLGRVLKSLAPQKPAATRLHFGCGRNILEGWLNLDAQALPGVDLVADLDNCSATPLPLPDNAIEEFLGAHVLEHLRHPLPLMQELHRVARPGARMVLRTPYGSSDDADEDPTHVRRYFLNSFYYFAQPYYFRADYGYRGDWQPEHVRLKVARERHEGRTPEAILEAVHTLRNMVQEIEVELVAVKPARAPLAELRAACPTEIVLV